jgi:hypothetical protein
MCITVGCTELAVYKVAASWSDGLTSELKTYGLACERCLKPLLEAATIKKAACRSAPGETLGEPRAFVLQHGKRDVELPEREPTL